VRFRPTRINGYFVFFTCHVADYDSDEHRHERAQQRIVHVRNRVQRGQYVLAETNRERT